MKIHSRHSPRKSMAQCNSPAAAGCGNSSDRAKARQKLVKNCAEHSLYDMKIHSRHSPRKSRAYCKCPAAEGCGNSSARAKTLQKPVKNCIEQSLYDMKIHSRHSLRKKYGRMAECNSPVAAGCGLEAESCEDSRSVTNSAVFCEDLHRALVA